MFGLKPQKGNFLERCWKTKGLFRRYVGRETFWLSLNGLITLLSLIFTVWVSWAVFTYFAYESTETSGPAGDKFGGITALFSGLAFAGLVFTLFVQKKELQYQREELGHLVEEQRQTKGHLKDQATHLKSQSDFIERQIFESNFFQLLRSFNEYIANTRVISNKVTYEGHDAYGEIFEKLRRVVSGFYGRPSDASVEFEPRYDDFYEDNRDDLGPYYRQLYNILKFIRDAKIEDQKFYSNIVRAQLSSSELSLLSCNIASKYGSKKMAPLVKDFDLLKHFDNEKFLKNPAWDSCLDIFFSDWAFFEKLEGDPLLQK